MKVLVTAFKPFNKMINNYSEEVLNYIENVDKMVLDVNYDKSFIELEQNFSLDEYDLIISLGEARSRKELTLETQAVNISSCSIPDNSNVLKKDEKIIDDGLDIITTGINIYKLENIIKYSNDAGKFVCNNLYYHLLTKYRKKSLFIHIPHCFDDDCYIKHANTIIKIIDVLLNEKNMNSTNDRAKI